MTPPPTLFRQFVRAELRCLVHGTPNPDPHHVRAVGMGGTSDPEAVDVENVVPLCRLCHDELHRIGSRTWERKHGINLELEAVRTWAHWERGGLPWLGGW